MRAHWKCSTLEQAFKHNYRDGNGRLTYFLTSRMYALTNYTSLDATPRARAATHYGASLRQPLALSGTTMGTIWSVRAHVGLAHHDASLRLIIERVLDNVITQMSHWATHSALTRFNQAPAGWYTLPSGLLHVLEYALKLANTTAGACDPTLGIAVNLWGFGPPGRVSEPPAPARLQRARDYCGWQKLKIDARSSRAYQPGGLHLDLSAMAKGYGVDAVAWALEAAAVHDYLIEIGGELRARGRRPDGQCWHVAIEIPDGSDGHALVIPLHNTSIATSGDYRRYLQHRGRRYAHTLDPATLRPLDNDLASVTVLHTGCMQADALATALNVMGATRGMAYAQAENLAALFIVRRLDGLHIAPSASFASLLTSQKAR